MLLIKIAVYVLCAALSLPIFPYFIWGRQLIRSSESGQEEKPKLWQIILFIIEMIAVIALSITITNFVFENFENGRQIWYAYLLPFACPLFYQFLWACFYLKIKLLPIVLPALAITFSLTIFLPIRDHNLPYQELSYSLVAAEDKEPIKHIDRDIIMERYKTKLVSYQGHIDESDVYFINGETVGFGVLTARVFSLTQDLSEGSIIDYLSTDLDGYSTVEYAVFNFYPCSYTTTIKGSPVRDRFKSEEIVSLGIVIDDETPYGKFGILKRDGIFERPQIDYYVLLNMVTGEIIPLQESTTL